MERFVNTDKPLSSLTGIRQVITKGDNDTNIKYQSKTKLERLDNLLFDRQQTINQIREIEKDIYNNIIVKLKKLLSNKFSLSEQEYLLLVDKFQLKKNELSREKIKEMIMYLNFQKKYDEKPVNTLSSSESTFEQKNMTFNHVNVRQNNTNFNRIIPAEFEPDIEYLDRRKSKTSLEDKLKIMQMERDKLNPQINSQTNPNNTKGPPHTNFNISNPNIQNMKLDHQQNNTKYSKHEIGHKEIQMNNIQKYIDQNIQYKTDSEFNSGEKINISNFDTDNSNNNANSVIYDKPHKHVMQSPEFQSNIINSDIEDERPKLIIGEYTNSNHITSLKESDQDDINLKIQDSLKQIADNLCKNNIIDEENVVQETKSMNLMANIISTKSAINSTSENLEFKVNYNGKGAIENVVSIELISCFINHNFYDKNSFSKIPYLLIKIKEFEDILYLNDTTIGGFCQIIWERKPNDCYTYINSDKLFGIYNPDSPIKLDKLTIELFNHRGKPINIKSTDKDQFNLVFKIKQNI